MRAFADGFVSLLLPFYLTLLGFSALEVGALVTVTLLGSGLMTLAAGFITHRFGGQRLLLLAAALMCLTGIALAFMQSYWPLLAIAFVGTLNPTTSDVTLFAPLEQSLLAQTAPPSSRTALFARYSVVGSFVVALGSQAAALPAAAVSAFNLEMTTAVQLMFGLYAALGAISFGLYRRLSFAPHENSRDAPTPLHRSKKTVFKLAALFTLDSFGGGFVGQSLLALWLFQRFDLSVGVTGTILFWTGVFAAFSQLLSPVVARRMGSSIRWLTPTSLPIYC